MHHIQVIYVTVIVSTLMSCFPSTPSETIDEEIGELSNTQWQLRSPKDLEGTIQFNENVSSISGFNGCNEYGAEVNKKNYEIEFKNFVSTERYCKTKDDQERQFMFLLSKTRTYRLTRKRLHLIDENGTLLTFEPLEE